MTEKNKEGQTVYTTDVIADRVKFLDWTGNKTNWKDLDLF